jgi:hypothetical protein
MGSSSEVIIVVRTSDAGRDISPLALIPVLVTGIQPPRVCAVKESFQPKDLGWLDLCDIPRASPEVTAMREGVATNCPNSGS